MGVSVDVDIEGADDLLDVLDDLPKRLRAEFADILNEAAEFTVREAVNNYNSNSTQNTGVLRSTIGQRVRATASDLEAIVSAGGSRSKTDGFDYALAIEFGTRPHFPPVKAVTGKTESLDRWVELKAPAAPEDGQTEEEANEQKAFNIAKQIARRGTPAQPFMRPATRSAERRLTRELRSFFDRLNLS